MWLRLGAQIPMVFNTKPTSGCLCMYVCKIYITSVKKNVKFTNLSIYNTNLNRPEMSFRQLEMCFQQLSPC